MNLYGQPETGVPRVMCNCKQSQVKGGDSCYACKGPTAEAFIRQRWDGCNNPGYGYGVHIEANIDKTNPFTLRQR